MRFRIQTEDGRTYAWEQDGPAVFTPITPDAEQLVPQAELFLTDAEATELCLELSYQIMKARHPERNYPD